MRKRESYEVEFKVRSKLGLKKKTEGAMSGVGRVLAKAIFGFNSEEGRVAPDCWFLPENRHNPAIIVICMAPEYNVHNNYSERILRACLTAFTGPDNYDKMTGILYNGEQIRVFKSTNGDIEELPEQTELLDREYYLNLWNEE